MGFLSFALVAFVFAKLSVASPQGSASQVPAITGPASGPAQQCGGCYVVADVAGIFFGNVTVTQTHTELVSIGVTPNGTNITSTSLIAGITPFTAYPSGIATPGLLSLNFNGPIITINGVELTSPTAYDVFTAYSLTSMTIVNGLCVPVSVTASVLHTAIKIPRPINAGADFDRTAEELFISSLDIQPTCSSPGGVNSIPTTAAPATAVTATSTTVGPVKPTLTAQPIQSLGITTVTSTVSKSTLTTKATLTTTVVIVPITTPLSLPTVSPTSLLTSTLSLSPSSSSSSSSSTISSGSNIIILPLTPISSPTTASSPILSQASTTKTSVISIGTIIIVSNSTYLQTGAGASATIVPFKGDATNMRIDLLSSWLVWGSSIFGTMMALCAL